MLGGGIRRGRQRLVVQQSFPEPRPTTNPYIVMLKAAIDSLPEAELRTFAWSRAILRRYDVMHIHWPEILVFGQSRFKTLARQALAAGLLAKLTLTGTPVVRTVHNLELPDPLSRSQAALLRWFDRLTVLRIVINPITALPPGAARVLIVHGHYRNWFSAFSEPASVPGRLGYFGLVRRYKQVDRLLAAFADAPADWSLRVAGKPSDDDVAERVRSLAGADDRVHLRLAYVDDAEIVSLVGESELVVLPYKEMHNSGSVLTALSLSRPVLVPANELNALISTEVGPGWVHQYEGDLTAGILIDTVSSLRAAAPTSEPDLSRREWNDAGQQHVAAYRRAIAIRRDPASGREYSR